MCAYGRGVAEPRLSPDGELVAVLVTNMGRGQIVVVPAVGGAERTITSDPPPRPTAAYGGGAFDWTPDGMSIIYAAVDGGLWSVAAAGGRPTRIVAPLTTGACGAPAVSPDGTLVAFVVDQHYVAVAPVKGSQWPVKISGNADFCFDPQWSADGRTVCWHEWDVPAMPWDEGRIAAAPVDGSSPPVLLVGRSGVQVQQPRFSPDGRYLAFLCDANGWLNLWGAEASGANPRPLVDEHAEHGDPSWGLGQRSFTWSPDGREIVFTRNERGFGTLARVDVASGRVQVIDRGVHGGLSWRGDRLGFVRSGARTPTTVVVRSGDHRRMLVRGPVAGVEDIDIQEPEVVQWRGDDGVTVYGRFYRPTAASPTGSDPPPLLLWIHGGPTGQTTVAWNNRLPFFLDRGWAVLFPDYRGSTGHGRKYTQALAGRWGDLDVADCAAVLRMAADKRWGDPRRMAVMGGSAGGFTVLNLLAHHSDLCAAGVDLFGPSDLFALDETTHRFEAHYERSIVGPLPEAADRYRERSPMNVVDHITAPLLILQGSVDNVVPPDQSRMIADRLRALGRDVEYHVYEGEGHGWSRPDVVIDELERIDAFLTRHVLQRRA
jgi:dipeptidyl aminopeptidase/acylaminoacyl peptidase